jgi:hypothetical protein
MTDRVVVDFEILRRDDDHDPSSVR